ncbi:MAG: UDP-N-acetylmuramoyl-L-alanine--D-glutamate ligase [Bifidobacteriaceae bacterium]|nr:UDP-N-acetylmuramoyl-L-alanine--D-glutamate ligase [Bifidobacteriaceae bacterium]
MSISADQVKNWAGRRVAVAGLGISGQAVVAALRPLGADLLLVEDAPTGKPSPAVSHPELGDVLPPSAVAVDQLDLLIVSPGWAPHHPLLLAARQAAVPVWSEVELAWRLRAREDAPWLAVTGTNGKTTVVQMLASILAAASRRVVTAGNVGNPLVTAVLDPEIEVFAVELSSFQLQHTYSMQPLAAALLNVAPDHLDWHGSLEDYAAAKGRIFQGVTAATGPTEAPPGSRGAVLFGTTDPIAQKLAATALPGVVRAGFTLAVPLAGQLGLVGSSLVDRAFYQRRQRHGQVIASLEDLSHLAGPGGRPTPHVVANALAAAGLALAYGVEPSDIGQGLRNFHHQPHRLAHVVTHGEVRYVDDSKATNAHAAAAALAAFPPRSVVWIAGGLAKGARFESLVQTQADRLKAAVLIGIDRTELRQALAAHAPTVPVIEVEPGPQVMLRAVQTAQTLAQPGDVVLLAPASASMDQFQSYAERGQAFAQAAQALSTQTASATEPLATPRAGETPAQTSKLQNQNGLAVAGRGEP